MPVHIQHTAATVRWYREGSFAEKSPYSAVCSLFFLEEDHVFIYAMNGDLKKSDMVELFQELQKIGIKHITAERKGKLVMRDVDFLLGKA